MLSSPGTGSPVLLSSKRSGYFGRLFGKLSKKSKNATANNRSYDLNANSVDSPTSGACTIEGSPSLVASKNPKDHSNNEDDLNDLLAQVQDAEDVDPSSGLSNLPGDLSGKELKLSRRASQVSDPDSSSVPSTPGDSSLEGAFSITSPTEKTSSSNVGRFTLTSPSPSDGPLSASPSSEEGVCSSSGRFTIVPVTEEEANPLHRRARTLDEIIMSLKIGDGYLDMNQSILKRRRTESCYATRFRSRRITFNETVDVFYSCDDEKQAFQCERLKFS